MNFYLAPSDIESKKFMVYTPKGWIDFGAKGYSDYTIHKDDDRKKRYIKRHQKRENWNKSGINTAGFWSRWLLWNKPTLEESIKDVEDRFGIRINIF